LCAGAYSHTPCPAAQGTPEPLAEGQSRMAAGFPPGPCPAGCFRGTGSPRSRNRTVHKVTADACCQRPPRAPAWPSLWRRGGPPASPPALPILQQGPTAGPRDGIEAGKGGLWCVSCVILWERELEGAPPAGRLAGLSLAGGRGCLPPPRVRGALCTWEMQGGHGCRGGHCSRVPVSCGPHSPHAVTMGHVHIPLPVPGVGGQRSGTPGCSRHCLGYAVSGLESQSFEGLDGVAESRGVSKPDRCGGGHVCVRGRKVSVGGGCVRLSVRVCTGAAAAV